MYEPWTRQDGAVAVYWTRADGLAVVIGHGEVRGEGNGC